MNINALNNSISSLDMNTEKTKEQKDKELKETCAAFEGMFLQMMMKTMRTASVESTLIKKSRGEKIFTDMLDAEYVNLAAKNESTGLGGSLYSFIKQTVDIYKDEGNNFPDKASEMKKVINVNKNLSSDINIIG